MTPLLLIPGMLCDGRIFTPQIAALSKLYPIQLCPITQQKTVQALAADILNTAPPKFAVAGLSMGGIVAMEVYRQANHRVSHLALLDTNPKAELPEVAASRELLIKRAHAGELKEIMQFELKPKYLVQGDKKISILNLCTKMALELGAEVFERQSRALQTRPDQQETLKSVKIPTLVLRGEKDQLCPLELHQLMHRLISTSKLEIIENAGHLPTLEQPKAVNTAFLNWLTT